MGIFRIPRATTAERTGITPGIGELIYDTDLDTVYSGDGSTAGGNPVTLALSGIADGDYGDITVSGSGAVMTVDNDAITYAKIQNVSATDQILGRSTAGAGNIEEIACTAAGRALLDDANNTAQRTTLGLGTLATQNGTFSGTSSGTNTGDQDLSGLVPYTGATSNVNLGTYDIITDTAAASTSAGLLVESANGTDVVLFGAGNTANVAWYGAHNFSTATQDTLSVFSGSGKTLSSLAASSIATSGTHLTLTAQTATDKPLAIKGAASQTANLAEFQNSSGTAFLTVGAPTLAGDSATKNFVNLTATMPSTMTAVTNAVNMDVTSAGSSAFQQNGLILNLNAGYTGGSPVNGFQVTNAVAGTGANYGNSSATLNYRTSNSNCAARFTCSSSTTGINNGGQQLAAGSSTANYGSWCSATSSLNTPALNVGLMSTALNATTNVAGAFMLLGSGTPSFTSCALLADNGAQAVNIFTARDNGTNVFEIQDGGKINILATNTASGTTGNQTINKPSGKVNIAAAGTTVTVTNSMCATTSIVIATLLTNDATATIKNVVPGAGSFVITLSAACTAEVAIGFLVIN